MEYTAKSVRTTPREVWLSRASWQNKRDQSIEAWKGLSVEEREAVVKFVRTGMERLYDSAEEWIPEGLEVKVGETLEVSFKIFFTEIREDIARTEEASTFRIREAIQGNEQMVAELGVE